MPLVDELFISVVRAEVQGFDTFNEMYMEASYFGPVIKEVLNGQCYDYQLQDGYLFKGTQFSNCAFQSALLEKRLLLNNTLWDTLAVTKALHWWRVSTFGPNLNGTLLEM